MESTVIKTAGRMFEVLEYFREVRRPLSIREIAEHFQYPLSSTSVLIRSFATLGYLSYDQKKRAYFPTLRLATLGEWVYEWVASGNLLPQLVRELAERTEETAVIAVQNDIFSQYVEVVPGRHSIQVYFPPGTRRLMCISGTGWSLLAGQSEDAVRKVIHRTNLKLSKNETRVDYDTLQQQLEEVRSLGYAFSKGTVTPGAGVIAMALPQPALGAPLSIAVAGVLERLEPQRDSIVKMLRNIVNKHAAVGQRVTRASR
jgi:DNA-binding IclR family transcriptional regulator